jgi:6-phosphogluconate dehydrogenase
MQLGMIGLGRMGGSMVRRLLRGGHACVVFDSQPASVTTLTEQGAAGAASLREFVEKIEAPRAIWLMLPAAVVEKTLGELVPLLQAGDLVIDGGNSHYVDDIRRAKDLNARGIYYVDAGVSGGVWGADRGYCLMVGGAAEAVRRLDRCSRRWRWHRCRAATPARSGHSGADEATALRPSGAATSSR